MSDTAIGWWLVVVFLAGILVGVMAAADYQRYYFCPALLEHATTAADSLAVAREFGGCWDHLKDVAP